MSLFDGEPTNGWAGAFTILAGAIAVFYKFFFQARKDRREDGEGADSFSRYRKLLAEYRGDIDRLRANDEFLRKKLDAADVENDRLREANDKLEHEIFLLRRGIDGDRDANN